MADKVENTVHGKSREESVQYVEVLGDTIQISHVVFAIVISVVLSFGAFQLGQAVLPGLVTATLVNSYSLLLAMVGCVVGLIINAKLFKPKRILSETVSSPEEQQALLRDLEVDIEEESRLLENDPATRAELESLNLLHLFTKKESE